MLKKKKDINLLLVTPLPPPSGGIATWSRDFVKYWKDDTIRKTRPEGLKLKVVDNAVLGSRKQDFHAKKSMFAEVKRTWRTCSSIRKVTNECCIEAVHLNSPCSPLGIMRDYLSICAVGKKIPVCLHCRCTIQDQLGNSKMGKLFFRLAVRRAAVVLVLNDQSKNYVSALSNKPVVKIPNFIDENILLKTEKVVSSCIRKVVFVGHAQKAKGYFEIAEVAERMPHIEFRIVGALHQECLSRSCPSNIIVVGDVSRDRVIDELDAADVFLFPSHTEGFANALTEAMARGLPVVTTNVGANYDMIEDKGGIVVPVNDSGAIVKALNHLEDPAIRAYMSVWNVEKVRNFYLIDKVVDQLLNVYRETAS